MIHLTIKSSIACGLILLSTAMGSLAWANQSSDFQELEKTLSESSLPESKAYREDIKNNLSAKGQIKGIQELPITKFIYVEASQGSYIISGDGRFVFEGTLKDVWHRKTIASLEDARSTERVPLSNIGFNPEEQLASFTIGNPNFPRQGVIFVDPTSEITLIALKKINQNPSKTNWTAVLLPLVGGDNAMDRSRRLWCAEDREGAKQDLINGTSISLNKMQPNCKEDPLVMGMMLTDILQIRSLPHLVREDGLKSAGYPEKFDQWFSQR